MLGWDDITLSTDLSATSQASPFDPVAYAATGYDEDELTLPPVVVPGYQSEPSGLTYDDFMFLYGDTFAAEDLLQGIADEIGEELGPEPDPCTAGNSGEAQQFPEGVDPDALRDLARQVGDDLWNLRHGPGSAGNEWMAFLVRSPTGALSVIGPIEGDSPTSIPGSTIDGALESFAPSFAAGSRIVAWIHIQGSSIPSNFETSSSGGSDWGAHNAFLNALAYDMFPVADPNMILYVQTDRQELFEYTKADENTSQQGQNLNNDSSAC